MPARLFTTALVAALSFSQSAPQAQALSCAQPHIVRSYQEWSGAKESYMLVRGTLFATAPTPKMPKTTDINNPPDPPVVIYRFEGKVINNQKEMRWQGPVKVDPNCLAAWCGGYPKGGQEAIMAFEQRPEGYVLNIGPCPGGVFTRDLDRLEQTLNLCLAGQCPKGSLQ